MQNRKDIVTQAGESSAAILSQVIIQGDLSKLSPSEQTMYYKNVCESVGLNPLTKPLEYITLQGKKTLYALKAATEQLRQIHGVSIEITSRDIVDDIYIVTARARDNKGRVDESIGAVPVAGLKGDMKANAIMKAETKAKRRVTLSITGLGLLDESEIETTPHTQPIYIDNILNIQKDVSIDESELEILRGKIREANAEEINICTRLKIDTIESMAKKDFPGIMRRLQKQIDESDKANGLAINQAFSME